MKKLMIIITLLLAVVTVACNKNQKAVKTLDGSWEEVSVDGVTIPQEERGTMNFKFCKLKKDEWCKMSYTDSDGDNSGEYDYQVKDKGEVLVQRIADDTKGTIELNATIKELKGSDMTLQLNFFGATTTTVYKKK